MYTVLVCVDEDATRIDGQVETVADLPNADEEVEPLLVHVFTDNPEGASVDQIAAVKEAEEAFERRGLTPDLFGASGEPAEEIVRIAEAEDVDAICVGGRRRSPTGKALFGSVSQEVILSSTRPVICAPAE